MPGLLHHRNNLRHVARKSPLGEPLRRRIARGYLTDLVTSRLRSGRRTVAGFSVRAPSTAFFEFLYHEVFLDHCYYFKCTTPTPFIVDCGSNIGMALLYFKLVYPDAEVLAFEPNPDAFAVLTENVASNGLLGVELRDIALGGTNGEVPFFKDADADASMVASTLEARGGENRIMVPQHRLSGFIDRPVDYLKIDIEGVEETVLADLVETEKIAYIDQMTIEYHHHIDGAADTLSTLLGKIEGAGFGYQIGSYLDHDIVKARGPVFQDVTVYAYNKRPVRRD